MAIIAFIIAAVFGFRAERISWKPFAVIAAISAINAVVKAYIADDNRSYFGENTDWIWTPENFAMMIGSTFVIYSAGYLIGFAIGRWRRR